MMMMMIIIIIIISSSSSSSSSITCHLYAGYYVQSCTYITVTLDNAERLNLEF
jgi:hypothetical protein